MFQPQPTPYATFYGMGSGSPRGYAYNQQQPPLIQTGTYLGGEQGVGSQRLQQQVGGAAGGAGGGGSYGPGGGLAVDFAGVPVGGIGASGAGATGGATGAASGPAGASSLLFISPAFNNNHHARNGPEPGRACIPLVNNYPHHQQHQPLGNFRRSSHHRAQHNIKMESDRDYSADLAAQEAAAREYQPQLEVRHASSPFVVQLRSTSARVKPA